MIDFSADIISYKSLGNIEIGRNVNFYIDELYKKFDVEVKRYKVPSYSEIKYGYYLNNSTIVFSTDIYGRIVAVGCNENYKGKYKKKLYTGITMRKLISITDKFLIKNGSLIVNEDFGMSITLPPPFDQMVDSFKDIPLDLPLNEICVGNFDSWRQSHKSKK
ncbi:hypothetical protein DKK71_09625 [Snodgrassella alvi]|uniref:hypothetical protein n=1 Tax=Snodgrassella alvi TaxID=1196083 RepID=UPI000D78C012|nr:hypothetical protein [Snodgrassella alvi]PXY96164.1 hypothetical protein DKK71_09625 [Snodgrassella alvi]